MENQGGAYMPPPGVFVKAKQPGADRVNESKLVISLNEDGVLFHAEIPLTIKLFLEIDLLRNGILKLPWFPLLVFESTNLDDKYKGIFDEAIRQTWRTEW